MNLLMLESLLFQLLFIIIASLGFLMIGTVLNDRNRADVDDVKTFALPAAASTATTSAVVDLGSWVPKDEQGRLRLVVPALSATIVPDTRTVTYEIQSSPVSGFGSGVITHFSQTFTGAGGAGVPAQSIQINTPHNAQQFVRARIAFGASTTDGSAVSATFSARY